MRRFTASSFFILIIFFSQQAATEEQCVELIEVPVTYNQVQQSYQTHPDEKLEYLSPTFATKITDIVVEEEHCPGDTMDSENISIVIRPAYSDFEIVPAVYETIFVQKQTTAPRRGWVLLDNLTIAYIDEPEDFRIVEVSQLSNAERAREIVIPEKTISLKVSRVVQPADQCSQYDRIPEKFKPLETQRLVTPGQIRQIRVPAKYTTITKKRIREVSTITTKPKSCEDADALPKIAAHLPEHPYIGNEYTFARYTDNTGEWLAFSNAIAYAAAEEMEPAGGIQKYMYPLEPLPWPPPRGSWLFPITRIPFENAEVMTDVEAVLAPALRKAGYTNQRYYLIDNPGGGLPGFAIVTQLEKWIKNGIPDPKNRFIEAGKEKFSLTDYIRNLFFAPEGTYRLILILVTDQAWTWDNSPENAMTRAKAKEWLFGGGSRLPDDFQTIAFTPRHTIDVVIYEFLRQGDAITIELPGGLTTAENHFQNSGLKAGLRDHNE